MVKMTNRMKYQLSLWWW